MKKETMIKIGLLTSIIIVPYLFILLMGCLEKAHIFPAYRSIYVVIGAGLLLIGMSLLNIFYWKKIKAK